MKRLFLSLAALGMAGFIGLTAYVAGQFALPDLFGPAVATQGRPNLPAATFGGLQFWTDIRLQAGWRIQRNFLTGHHRLLDDENIRQAWGNLAEVEAAMNVQAPSSDAENLVVLIHGALRSRASFAEMKSQLEQAGYQVATISYASSQRRLEDHADDIEALLDHLSAHSPINRISFVTHSMGGLVLRHLLSRPDAAWRERVSVDRAVLIAPPNQGSIIAQRMRDVPIFRWTYGPAGQQMLLDAAHEVPLLDIPFAIIAGGSGDRSGKSALIPGDDDGIVAVAETQLVGARDFILVDALHSFILGNPDTIAAVLGFMALDPVEEQGVRP